MRGPIMLKQLVDLLHLSLPDLVISGGFITAFLTGVRLPYLLFFLWPRGLITSTDLANLFARNFSCNSTLDGSQQLPDFPFCTEQRVSSKNINAKMVSRAILKCVLQSFLLFLLSCTINAWPNLVFLPVGNLHWLCQFLNNDREI